MTRRRTMVRAGTVKAGGMVHGRVVTGLGRTWTLPSEDNCVIGAAPWETVTVQYAYLEDVRVETDTERQRRERAERRSEMRRQEAEAARQMVAAAQDQDPELTAEMRRVRSELRYSPNDRGLQRRLAELEQALA